MLLLVAAVAFSCYLLTVATALAAHIAVTLEVLILIACITVVPDSEGAQRRFLTAFIGTAVVVRLFSDYSDWAPFELIHERAWLAIAQLKPNPPPSDVLDGPRPAGLTNFLDTARPLTGLFLATLSALVARAMEPSKP